MEQLGNRTVPFGFLHLGYTSLKVSFYRKFISYVIILYYRYFLEWKWNLCFWT